MKIITDSIEEIEELPLPTLDIIGRVEVPKPLGRPEGKKNIGTLEKELIAIHSNMGAGQTQLAELFNVSQAEVSIIERGIDRTNIDGRKTNEKLEGLGQEAKKTAMNVAEKKLLKSLEIYNPEALEQKHLPSAANQLASVYEKLSNNRSQVNNNIQFVVMQPRTRSEEDYETIVLNER